MCIFSFLLCFVYFSFWAKLEALFGFAGVLTTLCVHFGTHFSCSGIIAGNTLLLPPGTSQHGAFYLVLLAAL